MHPVQAPLARTPPVLSESYGSSSVIPMQSPEWNPALYAMAESHTDVEQVGWNGKIYTLDTEAAQWGAWNPTIYDSGDAHLEPGTWNAEVYEMQEESDLSHPEDISSPTTTSSSWKKWVPLIVAAAAGAGVAAAVLLSKSVDASQESSAASDNCNETLAAFQNLTNAVHSFANASTFSLPSLTPPACNFSMAALVENIVAGVNLTSSMCAANFITHLNPLTLLQGTVSEAIDFF